MSFNNSQTSIYILSNNLFVWNAKSVKTKLFSTCVGKASNTSEIIIIVKFVLINYLWRGNLGIIEDIKTKATKAGLKAFKTNLKRMTPDQILELLHNIGNDTARNIFKDIEKKGLHLEIPIKEWDGIKEKWLK